MLSDEGIDGAPGWPGCREALPEQAVAEETPLREALGLSTLPFPAPTRDIRERRSGEKGIPVSSHPFCNFQPGQALGSCLWALQLSHCLGHLREDRVLPCSGEGASAPASCTPVPKPGVTSLPTAPSRTCPKSAKVCFGLSCPQLTGQGAILATLHW